MVCQGVRVSFSTSYDLSAVNDSCDREDKNHGNSDEQCQGKLQPSVEGLEATASCDISRDGLWWFFLFFLRDGNMSRIICSDVEPIKGSEQLDPLCRLRSQWIEGFVFWNLGSKVQLRILVLQSQEHGVGILCNNCSVRD